MPPPTLSHKPNLGFMPRNGSWFIWFIYTNNGLFIPIATHSNGSTGTKNKLAMSISAEIVSPPEYISS